MPDVSASGRFCQEVTPSDSTVVTFKSLYIGGAGNVTIAQKNREDPTNTVDPGPSVTFVNVPAGTFLPVHGVRVMAATGATNIVAMDW